LPRDRIVPWTDQNKEVGILQPKVVVVSPEPLFWTEFVEAFLILYEAGNIYYSELSNFPFISE
jgi:hypothetical protein